MATAFQNNAFQNSAFQIVATTTQLLTDTTILQKPINAVIAGQQQDPRNRISAITPLIKYD